MTLSYVFCHTFTVYAEKRGVPIATKYLQWVVRRQDLRIELRRTVLYVEPQILSPSLQLGIFERKLGYSFRR